MKYNQDDIQYLLSPKAIRARSREIYQYSTDGKGYFQVNENKLESVVDFVCDTIKENYPDLKIPFHSRWNHFNVGGIERLKKLENKISAFDSVAVVKSKLDLVVVSVLLDAGAGPLWSYEEDGKKFSRSEGLAVASIHMFLSGAFSSDPEYPMQVDGTALSSLTAEKLSVGFQVQKDNPLEGLEGRVQLLNSLGKRLIASPLFVHNRPGDLYDYFIQNFGKHFSADKILQGILLAFGPIWPGRLQLGDVPMGDVWQHSKLESQDDISCLVPFHKLSQWLSYSLIEPLQDAGFEITDLDNLTGLAEYRNGGLLVDMDLISLKDANLYMEKHHPSSDLVIEWRALTIYFLDVIAEKVREKMKLDDKTFPLVKVLEGGTWWAGRKIASKKRNDGSPPINIASDGTTF